MHHLIIGAGPAGVIAAENLRKLDPGAEITLIGDEPEPPYSRMALPYLLIDKIDESGTYLRKGAGHYEALGIALERDTVTTLDAGARSARLAGGETLAFDRALIATGSHPVSPPIPGIDSARVHPCWTLADARAIAAGAQPGARVVLMGAGFIGCIILEALSKRGVELTVVEMGNRMVPRMMNETSGTLIKRWCESKGVAVHTSTKVEAIEETGGALGVRLDSGEVLGAELVISATGVRPNTAFLAGSGVEVDEGIKVDTRLASSVEGVYAAGDVAQGRDFSTGGYTVQAIQPTAAEHGRLAALNMVGRETHHPGCVNMNVLDTLGLISSSFGLWQGVEGGESAELADAARYRYLNLQFQDDVIVGASALGVTEHVGVLRGLIQGKVRLGPWRARLERDPTRLMEAYMSRTQTIGASAEVLR